MLWISSFRILNKLVILVYAATTKFFRLFRGNECFPASVYGRFANDCT